MVQTIEPMASMFIDKEVPETDTMQLLRMIYNDDEHQRKGDISAYLDAKTSPELREYIRLNILGSVGSRNSSLGSADDDTIELFIRHNGESGMQYRERLSTMLEKYSSDYEDLKKKVQTKQKSNE